MSNVFIGIDGKARHVKTVYVGVNGIARKVTKGYIGVDGIARQFYSASQPLTYSYTGNHTVSDLTVDGVEYTLLTLTGSGTLTVSREINADVWLCGGGGRGGNSDDNGSVLEAASGGGGGGGYVNSGNVTLSGDMVATVGGSLGKSIFGSLSATYGGSGSAGSAGSGGSGGGSGSVGYSSINSTIGSGAGKSTLPFSDSTNFKLHCGGGGGGGSKYENPSGVLNVMVGGNGGSNGSNGLAWKDLTTSDTAAGGTGGSYGGGTGGSGRALNLCNASAATFYGGGGGGAGHYYYGNIYTGSGGSGYQGVIYIRWKKEDAA